MKLLDKLLLRDLIAPFIFGVAAFTSVFFAGSYLLKLTSWVMNGMAISTALEVLLLILPSIVVYTLPMSTLLAVLLGMGRLSGDSEIVALFAGGVSIYRLAVPVIGLGIAVSMSSIALSEMVSPRAYLKYQEIQAALLQQVAPQDQPFTVRDKGTNSRVDVNGGMNADSGMLRDVTVTRYSKQVQVVNGREIVQNIPSMVLYAKRAKWAGIDDPDKSTTWNLYDGWCQTLGTDSPAWSAFSETHSKPIKIEKTPDELSLYQMSKLKDPEQRSFSELSLMIKYIKANPDTPIEKIRELEVERLNKLALPLSSLVFAMLAVPMGIKPHRSSSSVGLGMSILLILLYWMIWRYTSALAIQGNLPIFVGAFLADILGIVAAVLLLRKTAK